MYFPVKCPLLRQETEYHKNWQLSIPHTIFFKGAVGLQESTHFKKGETSIMKKGLTGYPSIDKLHQRGEHFTAKYPLIPNISIYQAFRLLSIPFRKDIAIDCEDKTITFQELLDTADTLSNALRMLGVRSNDIVTVCMPNVSQAIEVFFAANKIGAAVTFLSEIAPPNEVKHYLNLYHSRILFNYDKDNYYNQAQIQGTNTKYVVTLYPNGTNMRSCKDSPYMDYDSVLSLSGKTGHIKTWFSGKQNALILYTSGTTGNPKSVVLTNRNILGSAIYMKNSTHIVNIHGEKSLVCVPFTYPYGFSTSALMSLLCGRQVILAPNLSIDSISFYMKKEPNIIFGSPALLELIMRGTLEDQNLSSVTTFISGGDYLTPEHEALGKAFFAHHGSNIVICNGSGNAETTSCSTSHVGVPSRPGTVGKILAGSDAIIIDPTTRQELKYGEEGMLCVAGAHVFKEYYNEPELTKEAKFNYKGKTFYITGTRGILDEDGYFTLTGREARFYITSTLNKIYCDRVQTAIASLEGIENCAVVKKPDKDRLFVGKAYIVLKPDVPHTLKTVEWIVEKCARPITVLGLDDPIQLKSYEIPQDFEFMDVLPRTKADKIDYNTLEQMAQKLP